MSEPVFEQPGGDFGYQANIHQNTVPVADNVPTSGWTVTPPPMSPDERLDAQYALYREAHLRRSGEELAKVAGMAAVAIDLLLDLPLEGLPGVSLGGQVVDWRAAASGASAALLVQAVRLVASHETYRSTRTIAHGQLAELGYTDFPAEQSARQRRIGVVLGAAAGAAAGVMMYSLTEGQPLENTVPAQLTALVLALGAGAFFKIKGFISRRSLD